MLIVRNGKAYIQRKDLLFIFNSGIAIPEELMYGMFSKSFDKVFFVDNSNEYEFVEFDDARCIEFLKSLWFIIDFDEYSVLAEEPLMVKIDGIIDEKNALVKKYNSMSQEERVDNYQLVIENKHLELKIHSAIDFLNYQIGNLDFSLPDGIISPGRCVPKTTRFSIIDKFKSVFNKNKNK